MMKAALFAPVPVTPAMLLGAIQRSESANGVEADLARRNFRRPQRTRDDQSRAILLHSLRWSFRDCARRTARDSLLRQPARRTTRSLHERDNLLVQRKRRPGGLYAWKNAKPATVSACVMWPDAISFLMSPSGTITTSVSSALPSKCGCSTRRTSLARYE